MQWLAELLEDLRCLVLSHLKSFLRETLHRYAALRHRHRHSHEVNVDPSARCHLLSLVYGAITFHPTNVFAGLSGRRRETLVAGGCG